MRSEINTRGTYSRYIFPGFNYRKWGSRISKSGYQNPIQYSKCFPNINRTRNHFCLNFIVVETSEPDIFTKYPLLFFILFIYVFVTPHKIKLRKVLSFFVQKRPITPLATDLCPAIKTNIDFRRSDITHILLIHQDMKRVVGFGCSNLCCRKY